MPWRQPVGLSLPTPTGLSRSAGPGPRQAPLHWSWQETPGWRRARLARVDTSAPAHARQRAACTCHPDRTPQPRLPPRAARGRGQHRTEDQGHAAVTAQCPHSDPRHTGLSQPLPLGVLLPGPTPHAGQGRPHWSPRGSVLETQLKKPSLTNRVSENNVKMSRFQPKFTQNAGETQELTTLATATPP